MIRGILRGKIFSNLKKNRFLEVTEKGSLKYDAYNSINNSINIRNKTTKFKKKNYISPRESLQIFSKVLNIIQKLMT